MIKVMSIVGARPNFMKISPIIKAMNRMKGVFNNRLIHTGQHFDEVMSDSFFRVLGLPTPDVNLGCGGGSHTQQLASISLAFEKELRKETPDLVIVVGDVNSTLACTIVAKKEQISVAHIESGLRSRDMSMPEEINRKLVDAIADDLFTTSRDADHNLINEGIPPEQIHFVGNVMIDTLIEQLTKLDEQALLSRFNLKKSQYGTLTLHRPANVDNSIVLAGILDALDQIQQKYPIVFPIHPRTRKALLASNVIERVASFNNLILTDPLPYHDLLALNKNAKFVLTDSGGLQEETTFLGIPCLTLRENTERPITITNGTNILAGTSCEGILKAFDRVHEVEQRNHAIPEFWDGHAAERIVDIIFNKYRQRQFE